MWPPPWSGPKVPFLGHARPATPARRGPTLGNVRPPPPEEPTVLTAQLDRTTARAAVALANRAPSVHNSQPWRWRIGPTTLHLFADPARALPATDPDGRDLRISCGAALNHLRVALLAAGWDTRVHRLPDPALSLHLA